MLKENFSYLSLCMNFFGILKIFFLKKKNSVEQVKLLQLQSPANEKRRKKEKESEGNQIKGTRKEKKGKMKEKDNYRGRRD